MKARGPHFHMKLTWNGTGEGIGHWTREGRWHPTEGSHGRWRSTEGSDCVVEARAHVAWRRWGDLVLQLSGIRPVMAHLRGGSGGVGVCHHGAFWTVLHCGAFFLFALYAAHGYTHLAWNQRTPIMSVMMKEDLEKCRIATVCSIKPALDGAMKTEWPDINPWIISLLQTLRR